MHIPPGSNDLICAGSECIDIMTQASPCYHALHSTSPFTMHFSKESYSHRVERVGVMTGLPSGMWHACVVDYNNGRVPTSKAPHSQNIADSASCTCLPQHTHSAAHTSKCMLHRSTCMLFYWYAVHVHVGVDGTLIRTSTFVYLVPLKFELDVCISMSVRLSEYPQGLSNRTSLIGHVLMKFWEHLPKA